MSISSPTERAASYAGIYGQGIGRGDLESQVIQTIRAFIVDYIADYEAQHSLAPRSIPIPPVPESIHGGIDFDTYSAELMPEIIVVCQPAGEIERYDAGTYGAWFGVAVAAMVHVEGSQDLTRAQADAYGTALQKLIPQQGAFGVRADGEPFAIRTRLEGPYALGFPQADVRDLMRAALPARTFLYDLASDLVGPRVPLPNPYSIPLPLPEANRVEINLIRGTPDATGSLTADAVVLDGTVNPPVTEFEQVTVDIPSD